MKKTLILLALTSCVGPTDAETATYAAIAPAHKQYVINDANLTPMQKQLRLDLLESWRIRVEAKK